MQLGDVVDDIQFQVNFVIMVVYLYECFVQFFVFVFINIWFFVFDCYNSVGVGVNVDSDMGFFRVIVMCVFYQIL